LLSIKMSFSKKRDLIQPVIHNFNLVMVWTAANNSTTSLYSFKETITWLLLINRSHITIYRAIIIVVIILWYTIINQLMSLSTMLKDLRSTVDSINSMLKFKIREGMLRYNTKKIIQILGQQLILEGRQIKFLQSQLIQIRVRL